MAIGLGAMLGLRLPINFDAPYQALSPTDFWRRWHISLSTWLRDYLYIPLGGSRAAPRRMYVNLLLVMVIGGLWHGAGWTFVLWGAYHGMLLVAHKAGARWWDALHHAAQRSLTLLLVMLGWVLFRAPDVSTALEVYAALGHWAPLGAGDYGLLAGLAALVAFVMLVAPSATLRPHARRPWAAVVAATLFMASVSLLRLSSSPFLYYQF